MEALGYWLLILCPLFLVIGVALYREKKERDNADVDDRAEREHADFMARRKEKQK